MLIFNYCKTNPAASRQPKSKLQSKIQQKNMFKSNSTNQVVKRCKLLVLHQLKARD